MHEEAIDAKPFPRGMLIAAAALIGMSIILATVARFWDVGATRVSYAPVTEQRELIFQDLEDGSVGVVDASLKTQIAQLKPGQDGFVRVVMRSMARDRAMLGATPEMPFRLARHEDQTLSLTDMATGEVVMLSAFGGMNSKSFEQLLAMGRKKP